MKDRRSSFRKLAESMIRGLVTNAAANGHTAKSLRAALRRTFKLALQVDLVAMPKRPRAVWYAAVRAVAGVGILDLPDPQPALVPVGPRSRRRRPSRRKDVPTDAR